MEKQFIGTNGLWKIGGNTEDGILISSESTKRDIATVWQYDDEFLEKQEANANVRLISKSPELLSLLQNLVDMDSIVHISLHKKAVDLLNTILE